MRNRDKVLLLVVMALATVMLMGCGDYTRDDLEKWTGCTDIREIRGFVLNGWGRWDADTVVMCALEDHKVSITGREVSWIIEREGTK